MPMATRWKEHDCAIHWGCWQPLPEQDLRVEVPAIELVGPRFTWGEVQGVYNEVYQLKRAPGVNPCDAEMVENIHKAILNSVEEHLQHRWECTQPEEEPG